MLLTDQTERPSMKEIILNEYVQKKIKEMEDQKIEESNKKYDYLGQFKKKDNTIIKKKKLEKLSQREVIKKIEDNRKEKQNILNDLMNGKKVSDILKEDDNEPNPPQIINQRRISIESNITKNKMKKKIKVVEKDLKKKKPIKSKLNIHKKDKDFFSKLEMEYKKNIKGFMKVDEKFKKLENKANKIDEINEKKHFDSFHRGIVEQMDIILNKEELAFNHQYEIKNNFKKTKNSKPKITKREEIKKDFGEWFTEEYFQNCLKQEGEFVSKNELENSFGREEFIRDREISNIKRDFYNREENINQEYINEQELSYNDIGYSGNEDRFDNSFKFFSADISSNNNKLLMSISHGYTISHKKNRFGKDISKFMLNKKKKRIISDNNSFFSQFSIKKTKKNNYLKRLKMILRHRNTPHKRSSSLSHNYLAQPSSIYSHDDIIHPERLIYVDREMGYNHASNNNQSNNSSFSSQKESYTNLVQNKIEDKIENDLKIYITYHDKVLQIMNNYLKQKWKEEIENMDLLTNHKIQPKPKKALIYLKDQKKKIQNKQYIISSETDQYQYEQMRMSQDQTTLNPKSEENKNIFDESISFRDAFTDLSDIKEIKPQPNDMNTAQEMSYFEKINLAEEREVEKQLQDYLKFRENSIINNFTKIKSNIDMNQVKLKKMEKSSNKIMRKSISKPKINKSIELRRQFNLKKMKNNKNDFNGKKEIIKDKLEMSFGEEVKSIKIKNINRKTNNTQRKRVDGSRSKSKGRNQTKIDKKKNGDKKMRYKDTACQKKKKMDVYDDISVFNKKDRIRRSLTQNEQEIEINFDMINPFNKKDKIRRSITQNQEDNQPVGDNVPDLGIDQLRLSNFIKKEKRYNITPKLGYKQATESIKEPKKQKDDIAIKNETPYDMMVENLIVDEYELSIKNLKNPNINNINAPEQPPIINDNDDIQIKDMFYNSTPLNNFQFPKITESTTDKQNSSFMSSVNVSFMTTDQSKVKKRKRRKKNLSQKKIENQKLIKKLNIKIENVNISKSCMNNNIIEGDYHNNKNNSILKDLSQPNNVILEESFDERRNRWEDQRNERKIERSTSQQKFYKSLRQSLTKVSGRLNSIQKQQIKQPEEIQNIIKNSSVEETQKLDEIRKLVKTPSISKFHTKSGISTPKRNTSFNKESLISGKLNNFLKSFSLLENPSTPKKIDQSISPKNKISTSIIRKPILNNKNLKYLIESVHEDKQKPPPMQTNHEPFMQSGIPSSVSHSEHDCIKILDPPSNKNNQNNKKIGKKKKHTNVDSYNWNVKEIKKLTHQKKDLMKKLSKKFERDRLNQFLKQVFNKFQSMKDINQKDLHQLSQEYFSDFAFTEQTSMTPLYELIEIEIAIQSKTLSCIAL